MRYPSLMSPQPEIPSGGGVIAWGRGVYWTLAHALPTWLSATMAIAIGVLFVLVFLRFFSKVVLRILGVIVSVGLGIVAHLLLHPLLTAALERYTTWRA